MQWVVDIWKSLLQGEFPFFQGGLAPLDPRFSLFLFCRANIILVLLKSRRCGLRKLCASSLNQMRYVYHIVPSALCAFDLRVFNITAFYLLAAQRKCEEKFTTAKYAEPKSNAPIVFLLFHTNFLISRLLLVQKPRLFLRRKQLRHWRNCLTNKTKICKACVK